MGQDKAEYVVKNDYRVLMNMVNDDHIHTFKMKVLRFLFDIDDAFYVMVNVYVNNKLLFDLLFIILIPLILYVIIKIVIKFELYNPFFCFLVLILLLSFFDNNYDFPMFYFL